MSSCGAIENGMVRFRCVEYHSRRGDIMSTLSLHIPSKTVAVTVDTMMQAAE